MTFRAGFSPPLFRPVHSFGDDETHAPPARRRIEPSLSLFRHHTTDPPKLIKTISILCALSIPLSGMAGPPPILTYLDSFGGFGSGNGQFNEPYGIVFNPANLKLYVVDNVNNRIQRFDAQGVFELAWGTTGSGDGQFDAPVGIAVNPLNHQVFVTDGQNRRVQRFTAAGVFVSKWGTTGSGNGQFNGPSGIEVDSDNGWIYVSEESNSRVQRFDLATGGYLGKWGTAGSGDGQFVKIAGLSVDATGNRIYVADYNLNRIQAFDPTGAFQFKWGVSGQGNGQFTASFDTSIDEKGRVFVADAFNDRVQIFSAAGVFLGKFGSSGTAPGQMDIPVGVAVGGSGDLYVTDRGNNRVSRWRIVDPPEVSIAGRKRSTTTKRKLTIRGTADDADGAADIVRVIMKDGKRNLTAKGTSRWKGNVRLKPGSNRIQATAVDASGAISAPAMILVRRL